MVDRESGESHRTPANVARAREVAKATPDKREKDLTGPQKTQIHIATTACLKSIIESGVSPDLWEELLVKAYDVLGKQVSANIRTKRDQL